MKGMAKMGSISTATADVMSTPCKQYAHRHRAHTGPNVSVHAVQDSRREAIWRVACQVSIIAHAGLAVQKLMSDASERAMAITVW